MNDVGAFFNFIGFLVLKYIFRKKVNLDSWHITNYSFIAVGVITFTILILFIGWIVE